MNAFHGRVVMERWLVFVTLWGVSVFGCGDEDGSRRLLVAPVVDAPQEGTEFASPLLVEGMGVAGAEVVAVLSSQGTELVRGSVQVAEDARFSLSLAFDPGAATGGLRLEVYQERAGERSASSSLAGSM